MKRVLVALDTSENSSFVLARAIELAAAFGAKVRLVTAVQMPPIVATPTSGPIYVDPAVLLRPAETALQDREREVPVALRDGMVIQIGAPAEVICAVARAYDADLVVIGAHRHGLLARMLGTTAATIVNHIDRPVIVVRPIPAQPAVRAGALLRRDHARLEQTYEGLLAAYVSGDWEKVRQQWDAFEPAIRAHIETEEKYVFPELRAVNRAEADALLADHAELRRLLGTLGVAVDLHAFPAGDAEELIKRLRAHGAREEALLYPWMDEALDAKKLHRQPPAAQ